MPCNDSNRHPAEEDDSPIASRRYTNSHAPFLLNTAFALPATLAKFVNAHRARERCLFGPADAEQCEKLKYLEDRMVQVGAEGRQLYESGNVKALADKSKELQELDREADSVRKHIVEDSIGIDLIGRCSGMRQEDLVDEVATDKARQWAKSWCWESRNTYDHGRREWLGRRDRQDHVLENEGADMEMHQALHLHPVLSGYRTYTPRALERQRQPKRAVLLWRDLFEDMGRAEPGTSLTPQEQFGEACSMLYSQWMHRLYDDQFLKTAANPRTGLDDHTKVLPWEGNETSEEPSYEYEHDHEDQHDEPPSPEWSHRKFEEGMANTELDAYEQLVGPATVTSTLKPPEKPSVLSTLTTTEQTVAADGTITTKLILKKRFSDGTEEKSETLQTLRGQWRDVKASDSPDIIQQGSFRPLPQVNLGGDRVNDRKRGWFWSG